jgi:hypothetical protein
MASDTTNFTMIDVSYVPGNRVQAETYRVVLSRGGVNGETNRGVVVLEAEAYQSFLGRAEAILRQNAAVESQAK